MSFTAKIVPEVAMTGNPVLVKVESSGESSIRIAINRNNTIFYEAAAVPAENGLCTFSIRDLFSDAFPSVIPEENEELLKMLPDSLVEYNITILGKDNRITLPGKCYPGGISRKLMRYLSAKATDIFTAKFCNPRTNFFLTTRTGDSLITIRENEIGHLHCIGMGWTITVADLHGHSCDLTLPADRKIYAVNLSEIRRHFFEQGTLSSYFSISVNNKVVSIVAITPSTPNAVVLMFKNSFGVYEKIELAGIINVQPEMKKQETVYKYDEIINDFVGTADRSGYTPVFTLESGYKIIRELEFLQELLLSEDIYLINASERIRVMVSSTKMKFRIPLSEPQSIEIKMTFCDEEQYISSIPDYIDAILTNKVSIPITADGKKIQVNKHFNNKEPL